MGAQMLHPSARLLVTDLGSAVIYYLFSSSCSLPWLGGQLNAASLGMGELFYHVKRGAEDKGRAKDCIWLEIKVKRNKWKEK